MVYEYLLDYRATITMDSGEDAWYGKTEICWGEDEYDALNRFVAKRLRSCIENTPFIHVQLSQLRSTGRSKSSYHAKNPTFMECNARNYIKGLITRFMVRFLVSDTEEELEKYKDQFESFLHDYKEEFPVDVVAKMYNQYEKRLLQIKSGAVKTLLTEIKLLHSEKISAAEEIVTYSQQVAKILRMFGFRIIVAEKYYHVYIPSCYGDASFWINFDKGKANLFTPEALILFWQQYVPGLVEIDEE